MRQPTLTEVINPERKYAVLVNGKLWKRYADEADAQWMAERLRAWGLEAKVAAASDPAK